MSTTTMKALVANGSVPLYREDYPVPVAPEGFVTVQVKAAALTNLTKMRASGKHYSVEGSSDASAQPPVVGVDGVGVDRATGRRVYFAMPDAPNGGMAELCVVSKKRCIPVPDELDDVTAAAIANPGMSVWAGLVHRAKIQPGEIILINGATGTAGALAVQIAKVLGAKKVIATGRNANELQTLVALGADVTIPLPSGSAESPQELKEQFDHFEYQVIQQLKEEGAIDIVLDYLWGDSAASIITAVAKGIEDAHPVRFVQVGTASGQDTIPLAGAALRSSAIQLMGSGLKSIPMPQLIGSIVDVFNAFVVHKLVFSQVVVPLSEAPTYWNQTKPRVVFTP